MSLSNGKGKYLRLPYMIGHSKKSAFSYVRDQVARKNLGWKEKLLTQAGEEVLFDSVLQQGWRLLQTSESMIAKVMQEIYYSSSSFMEARVDNKRSYAWRSIWEARGLLEEEVQWRVENRMDIKVWKDRWFPILIAFNPQGIFSLTRTGELLCKAGVEAGRFRCGWSG
ncbi:hypothetical protein M9H77_08946 [Catharanthus roseus]|uniref:Uncharacterized protein n=1 Tax=Catharanthus roseus TaxID=4058 RepID=A0ACC0BZL9_CATRO|nr:hypothetical protein M9H77_08946 [Catharanthus roseus]